MGSGSLDRAAIEQTIESILASLGGNVATIEKNLRSTIEPQSAPQGAARLDRLKRELGRGGQRFVPESILGEGGMGLVYLAEQKALGRKVALKALRPEAETARGVEKLLEEAWIHGALEHPNIVPVHDIELDARGRPQVALKRIEGRHWGDLIASPDRVAASFREGDILEWNLRVLAQVCQAVHYAHARGFIHRDLKPENVMIGEFGEVYVGDWGLALALRPDPNDRFPHIGEATEIAGTPAYMAPEMLGGANTSLSERTDVYLLGGILYEIITGEPPHNGHTLREIFESISHSPPELPEGAPSELAAICKKALSLAPADRHESADAFRLDLEEFLRHRGSRQIAHRAERRLDRLHAAVRSGLGDTREGRDRIYALYVQCHYGFREALRAWSGNARAEDGMRRAAAIMIEWELSCGSPDSAASIMAGLKSPPIYLRAKVESALNAKRLEEERLAALSGEHDPSIGRATRYFLAWFFGLVWTLTPIVAHYRFGGTDGVTAHFGTLAMTGALLLLVTAAGVWARDSLTKSRLNRTLAMVVPFTFISMTFFWLGATVLGLDPHAVQIIHIFLWFSQVGVLVITTERRFWPTALALLASFFVAALFPDYRHLAIAFSNLVLTLNAVFLWRAPEKKTFVDRLALPVRAPVDLLAPWRRGDPDGP
jgi:eukaryotic-like serine/threonine-protein kinase